MIRSGSCYSLTSIAKRLLRSSLALAGFPLCFVFLALGSHPIAAQDDALTLRVEDTRVQAGGLAVVSIRTYAPRPIGSGQLCIRVRRPRRAQGEVNPDLDLVEVRVFGQDVSSSSTFIPDSEGGEIVVEFSSATGVNREDGPLIAAFLQLGPGPVAGDEFDLDLDLENTSLLNGAGQAITVDGRPGTLQVVAPGSPLSVDFDGEDHQPGDFPTLQISTREGRALSAGALQLSLPESLADQPFELITRFQYGSLQPTVTRQAQTLLLIEFTSPDSDFNEVPGALFELRYSKTLESGLYPVSVVAQGSSLLDDQSTSVPLDLEGGSLQILVQTHSASDFESGALDDWTLVNP